MSGDLSGDFGTGKVCTITKSLPASTSYSFKIRAKGTDTYYSCNSCTVTGSISNYNVYTGAGDITMTTAAAGDYVFTFDIVNKRLSITYPSSTDFVLVGNGSGNWLNGINWDNDASENILSGSPLSITFSEVSALSGGLFRIVQKGTWNAGAGYTEWDEDENDLTRTSITAGPDNNNIQIDTEVTLNITVTWNGASIHVATEVPCSAPGATTGSYSATTLQGATLAGTIAHDSNCTTSESGFKIYNDDNNSRGSYIKSVTDANPGSTTSLSLTVTGLTPGTKYWYAAYATNSAGTTEGSASSFTTTSCSSISIGDPSGDGETLCQGATATTLHCQATGGNGTLQYQWYKSDDTSMGSTGGADTKDFTPPTTSDYVGSTRYYCKVSSQTPCASTYSKSANSGPIEVVPTAVVTSVNLTHSDLCVGSTTTATKEATLGGGTGAWSSSNTSVATVADDGTVTVTAVAAGSANIIYTITGGCNTDPASNYSTLSVAANPSTGFEVTARLNAGDANGPWKGNEGSSNGGAAIGGVFADGHRQVTLTAPTGDGYNYYQWYKCDDIEGSNPSSISGATSATYSYNIDLPGTYYYLCKSGCSSAYVSSGVVQVDVPLPEFGVSGPFLYGGSWPVSGSGFNSHCVAGLSIAEGGGRFSYVGMTGGYHTWSATFKNGKNNGEFVVIQRYKRGCLCTECGYQEYLGWSGYQECNNKCSESGTATDTGNNANKINPCSNSLTNIDGGTGNWTANSSLSLSTGDIVTIVVQMKTYDTYNVSMTKGCASGPTIGSHPVPGDAVSVCATDAPTLSVAASGGTAPLTYQWYQSTASDKTGGTPVTGARTEFEGGKDYTPDAYSAGTPYYYYCIARSAGPCASTNSAESNVSKQITIKDTPLVSPTAVTVRQYEPVKITSTNTPVTWAITTPAAAPSDGEYYLYDNAKKSVMFKGEYNVTPYIVTATPTSAPSDGCTGTTTITVLQDEEELCD